MARLLKKELAKEKYFMAATNSQNAISPYGINLLAKSVRNANPYSSKRKGSK